MKLVEKAHAVLVSASASGLLPHVGVVVSGPRLPRGQWRLNSRLRRVRPPGTSVTSTCPACCDERPVYFPGCGAAGVLGADTAGAGAGGVTGAGVGGGTTAAIVWLTHADTRSTRVKMPGNDVLQFGPARLAIPTSTAEVGIGSAIAGPPLSPLQVPTADLT